MRNGEICGSCRSAENYKHLLVKEARDRQVWRMRFAKITEIWTEILSLFQGRKSRERTDEKTNQSDLRRYRVTVVTVTTLNRPNPDDQ